MGGRHAHREARCRRYLAPCPLVTHMKEAVVYHGRLITHTSQHNTRLRSTRSARLDANTRRTPYPLDGRLNTERAGRRAASSQASSQQADRAGWRWERRQPARQPCLESGRPAAGAALWRPSRASLRLPLPPPALSPPLLASPPVPVATRRLSPPSSVTSPRPLLPLASRPPPPREFHSSAPLTQDLRSVSWPRQL